MIITSEEKVEAIDVDFNEIVHPNRMNIKHFTTARKSLQVEYENESPYKNFEEDICFFGTDDEPFLIKVKYES